MAHVPQIRIPATYLRGGTSKGVFFRLQDLPASAQVPGKARDALLMRVLEQRRPQAGAMGDDRAHLARAQRREMGPQRRHHPGQHVCG